MRNGELQGIKSLAIMEAATSRAPSRGAMNGNGLIFFF
jgi:hypothetical protein